MQEVYTLHNLFLECFFDSILWLRDIVKVGTIQAKELALTAN